MIVTSLGLALDENDPVSLLASRSLEVVDLVIHAEDTHCEIRMDRVHVEALRDQLPAALAGLDRWAAEEAGCAKVEITGRQAVDLAARALDLALTVDQAGAHDLATSLRAAAAEATARAAAADAHVRAFEDATVEADFAAETLIRAMSDADAALGRSRVDRPAERNGAGPSR